MPSISGPNQEHNFIAAIDFFFSSFQKKHHFIAAIWFHYNQNQEQWFTWLYTKDNQKSPLSHSHALIYPGR